MKSQLVLWNVNPLACIPFWPARSCLGNNFRNPNPQRVRKGPHFPDFSYQKAGQMGSTAISLYNIYIYTVYIYIEHTHTHPKKIFLGPDPKTTLSQSFFPPFPPAALRSMHRPGVRWIRMATPHPRRGTGTAPRGGLLLGQRHRDMD